MSEPMVVTVALPEEELKNKFQDVKEPFKKITGLEGRV